MCSIQSLGATPFLLPALHANVPFVIIEPRMLAEQARLAQLFVRAGVLHWRDLNGDAPLEIVRAALQGWLHRSTGPLDYLVPGLSVDVETDEAGRWHAVTLTNLCTSRFRYNVGPTLEALQESVPGLGATVSAALQRQEILPLWTPAESYDQCVGRHWDGEDEGPEIDADDTTDGGEDGEGGDGGITRAQVNATFPKWARSVDPATLLSEDVLLALARRDDLPGRAAATVLRLEHWSARFLKSHLALLEHAHQEAPESREDEDEGEGEDEDEDQSYSEFVGYGAVLCWDQNDDITQRVSDDYYQCAMNDTVHDHTHRIRIDLDRPDLLRLWLDAQRGRNRGLRELDRLLALVADPVDE